jgi:protein involved in polysaccharide export with SLBB domain
MVGKRRTTKSRNVDPVAAAPAVGLPAAAKPAAAASKPAAAGETDYIIHPADILEIVVFQEPDLKSTLRVSNEGTIVFPLVGVVQVGGLGPQAAAQALRDKLAKGFLINPQVSVTVMEFSKRRFTVLGEVQKPGSYDMPAQQDVTVLQAIGMAGGYTRIANPGKVTLMRKLDGTPKTFALDARKMASGNAESPVVVQPGDVITVAESRF